MGGVKKKFPSLREGLGVGLFCYNPLMDTDKIYSELKSAFPNLEIYQNHPLAPYTTIKIGGPADIFIHTKSSEDLKEILEFLNGADNISSSDASERILRKVASEEETIIKPNITILGNGSNILISDSGIRGIVIKNDSQKIEILPNNQVKVDSGTQLSLAINFLADHQLSGLEEFSYIPSSVGGAIKGNIHGVNKNNFSTLLESIEVFDIKNSTIYDLRSSEQIWGYDYSQFQDQPNLIIISTILNLKTGETEVIKQTAKDIYETKSTSQLMNSLGCAFKNPPESICLPIWQEKKSAGWIIDQELNLKGYSIGDAQISPLHANFIINNGHATAKNYLDLVDLIQSQMQTKFGFQFELEIKLIGF